MAQSTGFVVSNEIDKLIDASPDGLIGELPTKTKEIFLREWGVYCPNAVIAESRILEAAMTQLALVNMEIDSKAAVAKLTVGTLKGISTPEWIIDLRQHRIPESDLRQIVLKLGVNANVIATNTLDQVNVVSIGRPAKRMILQLIDKWNGIEPIGVPVTPPQARRVVRPGIDVFTPGMDNTIGEFQPNPVMDLNPENVRAPETVKQEFTPFRPDPVLRELKVGEDEWTWLQKAERQLEFENCSDATRLRILNKYLSGRLLEISKRIQERDLNYQEFITALKQQLQTSAALASAQVELRHTRYDFKEHPTNWLLKFRSLLEKVKGPQTQSSFCFEVIEHLPQDVASHIYDVRANTSVADLESVLTNKYFEKKSKDPRFENQRRKFTPVTSTPVASLTKRNNLPHSNEQPREFTCYKCGIKGHTVRSCPADKPVIKTANVIDTYDNQSPRADDYIFTIDSIPMITNVNTPITRIATVKLMLCNQDKSVLKTGAVLLDTGAAAACIDYELAVKLKAYFMNSDIQIKGVGDSRIQTEGAAYGFFKHPHSSKVKALRFQIIKNFSPVLILGNRFMDIWFTRIHNKGGCYEVTLRDKPDGDDLIPSLMFRFCTPEESIALSARPESPIVKISEFENSKMQNDKMNLFLDELSNDGNSDKIELYLSQPQQNSFEERLKKRMDSDLTENQVIKLCKVFQRYVDVFSQHPGDYGFVPWQKWPIKIDIGDNAVPYQKPYPCTTPIRKAYQEIISNLLKNNIIEPSTAMGGSPALLVSKPDGSYRLLNDLRAVNRMTKVVPHPMPRVDSCLEVVRGAAYFNLFDLYQGYFQIELPPTERCKTVFVTPDGKYQYKRLPMGLTCAPFEFQRLMNKVLDGLDYSHCLAYFDDVPVMGKTFEELLLNTELVLKRLQEWNLKIKTDKCRFGSKRLVLLGHLVTGEGIQPDPNKVLNLKRLPYPKTVKQLQSQLGCFNYFSRYIANFAQLASPLYRLITKERKFKMVKQDFEALDKLKNALVETTMLVHFDPELRKKLTADASDSAVGGILLQEDANQPIPDGFKTLKEVPIDKITCWKPMYFFSQKLQSHQLSYSVSEKELFAILVGLRKFKHYLEGDRFVIETDHHALCQLPKVNFKNQRLQRWSIMMDSYKYIIVFKQGKEHPSDCFSRFQSEWSHRKTIDPETEYLDMLLLFYYELEVLDVEIDYFYEIGLNEVLKLSLPKFMHPRSEVFHIKIDSSWKEEVLFQQLQNEEISKVLKELKETGNSPYSKMYTIRNELLYKKPVYSYENPRIVITKGLLDKIFNEEHNSPIGGHFGPEKTYLAIARRFWMKGLYDEVLKLCNNCNICHLAKSTNRIYSDPQAKPIPEDVLERFELDAQGPITFDGGKRKIILVMIDVLSRFVYAKSYVNQTAATVQKFLSEFFWLFGYPKVIQTDRGRNFVSEELESFLPKNGIQHEVSNPYHPQSQGTVERVNRTIGDRLRTIAIENKFENFEEDLATAIYAINCAVHKIHRFSPYFLIFGRNPLRPIDNQLEIPNNVSLSLRVARRLSRARLISQQYYYINRKKELTLKNPYKIGDFCYVKNSAPSIGISKKLVLKYYGPYLVLGVKKSSVLLLDPNSYEISTSNLEQTKPYQGELTRTMQKLRENYFNVFSSTWCADPNEFENLRIQDQNDNRDQQQDIVADKSDNDQDKFDFTLDNLFIETIDTIQVPKKFEIFQVFIIEIIELIELSAPTSNYLSNCFKTKTAPLETSFFAPIYSFLTVNGYEPWISQVEPFFDLNQINFVENKPSKISLNRECLSLIDLVSKLPQTVNCYISTIMPTTSNSNDPEGHEDSTSYGAYTDPLPKKTALALRSVPKRQSESSILNDYPHPDDVPKGFVPAINPTCELPEFVSEEAFSEAVKAMKEAIPKFELLKQEYFNFIQEKLKFNILEVDLRDYPQLAEIPKGLNRSQVLHPRLTELTPQIVCYFCEHLAIQPKSCSDCDRIYCYLCVKWIRKLLNAMNFDVSKDEFLCISARCAISCARSDKLVKYEPISNKEILEFLKDAYFVCNRAYCHEYYLDSAYASHIQSCHKGPVDFSLDKFLKLPFLSTPTTDKPVKPNQLLSLFPYHIKKDALGPTTIKAYWEQKFEGYAFLIERYKDLNLRPTELRAECNLGINYWNNRDLAKDPEAPIWEGEEFLLKIGFPSCEPTIKTDPAIKHRHPIIKSGKIPSYLLRYTEWRKLAYGSSDTDSINSDSSSFILYSDEIEDPDGPFLRIDPYARVHPDKLREIKQTLKTSFPSCVNVDSIYRPPKAPGKPKSQQVCEERRKRIKQSFDNRPEPNLPPLKEIHMDAVRIGIDSCPNKELIIGINSFHCRILENGKYIPRPCWISIIDGSMKVIYESFVQYKEIDFCDTQFHGLTRKDLKFARNLKAVRDQVVKYLVCADKIIGYGLITQLRSLGLTFQEIMELTPKMRDVNNFYSPYFGHPMCLHFIAFLWFNGYVMPYQPHSPIVEITTAMWLYMLNWQKIEVMAECDNGIHFRNVEHTCANRITAALLYMFTLGVEARKLMWPEEWERNPRIRHYPEHNENCVPPDPDYIREILAKRYPASKNLTRDHRDSLLLEEAVELYEDCLLPDTLNEDKSLEDSNAVKDKEPQVGLIQSLKTILEEPEAESSESPVQPNTGDSHIDGLDWN